MSMNDVLSDTITRIRNGQRAKLAKVRTHSSRLVKNVLQVLKDEGYIADFAEEEISKGRTEIVVELKYFEGEPVIKKIVRRSSPGRRNYSGISKLAKPYNGLGITILSTSKGVMSDFQARQANVGGEVLCSVF